MSQLIITTLMQGMIYGILAIAVYLTYTILDIPDLSVEGTLPAGAFTLAVTLQWGWPPVLGILAAFVVGSLAGLMTALLFIHLKINPLLAGILTLTIMYSVNLRIGGSSNISLYGLANLFGSTVWINILIMVAIVLVIKLALDWFFKTELGYLLLATGDNEALVTSLGANKNHMKIIGLMLSNGLAAVSGALLAQNMKLADISMGTSVIVVGLASLIIGGTIMRGVTFLNGTTRAVIGALIYKMISGLAIYLGMAPNDLKAINGIIIILFIAYNNLQLGQRFNRYLKGVVKS